MDDAQPKKKQGASGLYGHDYEIMICSHILIEATLRMDLNKSIQDFFIDSNMDHVGALDDVIYKLTRTDKEGNMFEHVSFIQTKYRYAQNRNLTLEKLFAGDLQKYHDGFRKIQRIISGNKIASPLFSTDMSNVDVILMTNASLGGLKSGDFIPCAKSEDDFFKFDNDDNTNYYKLNSNTTCKADNKGELINVMDLLNDANECEIFVKDFIDELLSDTLPTASDEAIYYENKNILFNYQIPILNEIISVLEPGIGIINPTLLQSAQTQSPFVKSFLREISERISKPLTEIQLSLPLHYGEIKKNGELTLPYTKRYFDEFLDVFKIYVKQPDLNKYKKHIESKVKQYFHADETEAKDICIAMISKVREWWQNKFVDYLDKNNSIMTSIKSSICFNLNNPTNLFTGRSNKLNEFHQLITIMHFCVVHGLGGIGKTEFARRYIESYREFYDHNIIWIDAQDQSQIVKCFQNLIKTKLTIMKWDEAESIKSIKDVFECFSGKKCLFVYDNAENTEEFVKIISLMRNNKEWKPHVIITSRDSEWSNELIKPFKLDVLEPEEAVELIKKGLNVFDEVTNMDSAQQHVTDSDEDIKLLAETVQCFPLAIQQAISCISYLRVSEKYTIQKYVNDFHENGRKILNAFRFNSGETCQDFQTTTLTTWAVTMDKIASDPCYGDVAMLILRIIAYCAPNNIDKSIFLKLQNVSQEEINKGIYLLTRYSMLDEDDDGTQLNIHRLVQHVTRIQLDEKKDLQETVLKSALTIFDKNTSTQTLDHASVVWKFASHHETLVKEFGHNFKDIIDTLFKESRFEEANTFSDFALDILDKLKFSTDHEYVVNVQIEKGKTLVRLSEFDIALRLFENIRTDISTANQEKYFEVQSHIATIYSQKSEFDKALFMFEDVLKGARDILKPSDSTIIRTKDGIANIYKRKGRYTEAMNKFKEILETLKEQERTSEGEFDMTLLLQVKANIASCHKYLGEYEESLSIFNKILTKQRDKYGERNAITLRTLNNIAVVYMKLSRYQEALDTFHRCLEIKKTFFKDRNASVLVTKHNIAAIYLHLPPEKHKEGLELLKEVYSLRKDLHGPSHKSTLNSLKKLAQMLHMMGKYREALKINEEAYDEILNLHKNNQHPQALEFYTNIAKLYSDLGHKRKALCMMDEVLNVKMNNENFGENHPETLMAMYDKACILGEMGKVRESLNILYCVQDRVLQRLGSDHEIYKNTTNKLKHFEKIKLNKISTKSSLKRFIKQMTTWTFLYFLFKLYFYYEH